MALPGEDACGNLYGCPLHSVTNELLLAGAVQHTFVAQEDADGPGAQPRQVISNAKPQHVPVALPAGPPDAEAGPGATPSKDLASVKSQLSRACLFTLEYLSRVSRDPEFLRACVAPAAQDEAARGEEPRLAQMLEVLEVGLEASRLRCAASPSEAIATGPTLALVRTDYLVARSSDDDQQVRLCQVETNTVSAAFSGVSKAVQRAHAYALGLDDEPDDDAESADVDRDASLGFPSALARAHEAWNARLQRQKEATSQSPPEAAPATRRPVVLFVVLLQEHLLCESYMERALRERHGLRVRTLTLGGCARRLSLNATDESLLLDAREPVSVVYSV